MKTMLIALGIALVVIWILVAMLLFACHSPFAQRAMPS